MGATTVAERRVAERLPLYALIPTGPATARLLWVPWPGVASEYRVERRAAGQDKWTLAPASIEADYADVADLAEGDVLRVIALGDAGDAIGQSVGLAFTPVSPAPTQLDDRPVIDGRGANWEITDEEVTGTDAAPAVGAILVLPLTPERSPGLLRSVLAVEQHGRTWRAITEPQRHIGLPGTRVGATLNVSAEGVPAALLNPTSDGRLAYCSTSEWGCLTLDPTFDGLSTARERSNAVTGTLSQTWSTDLDLLGIDVHAEAGGGVIVEANYGLTYNWIGLPNGVDFAFLRSLVNDNYSYPSTTTTTPHGQSLPSVAIRSGASTSGCVM